MSRGRHRQRRHAGLRWHLLVAGAALAMLSGSAPTAATVDRGTPSGWPATGAPVPLELDFRPRVRAAEAVAVRVRGVPVGAPVSLITVGSVGAVAASGVAGADGAGFTVSANTTRWAGAVTLIARSGDAVVTETMQIMPGPVTGPALALVGPQSIVADGADTAMVVSVPTDEYGNAAVDGTVVDFARRHPTGAERQTQARTSGLVAHVLLRAGTTAGTGEVRAGVGAVSGPTTSLNEAAAPPVPFVLGVVGRVPAASGQSLLTVRTSLLRDRFGNVQPDGTEVHLGWTGPSGYSQAAGYTVGGVAQFAVEAPDTGGRTVFRAVCRGTAAVRPLIVQFRAVRPVIALTANRAARTVSVVVGPVTGSLGALVADGTPVTVSVVDRKGRRVQGSGQLVDGALRLVLPGSGLSGTLQVRATVLGSTRRIPLR
jgi:hypothetical protein